MLIAAASSGLAACESIHSTSAIYAADAGTAAVALEAGKELQTTTGTRSNVQFSYNNIGSTTSITDPGFSIKKNQNGGVDVTVGGKTTSFAATDVNPNSPLDGGLYQRDTNGTRAIYSWSAASVDAALDENNPNYSQVWEYFAYDDASRKENGGFAVVGTETRAADLPAASATYTGHGVIRGFEKANGGNAIEAQAGTFRARGINPASTLTLQADFDAATIEGEMTGLVGRQRAAGSNWSAYGNIPGSITLEKTSIAGNGFEGKLAAGAGLPVTFGDNSTYSGRFYGPAAEEAAGTFEIDGADGVGTGAFQAWR